MRDSQKVILLRAKILWLIMDMNNFIPYDTDMVTVETLKGFRDKLQRMIWQIDDPDSCTSSCKWYYFCELKKGHAGKHLEGGLGWEDKDADELKTRSRRKKKETKCQVGKSTSR